MVSFRVYEWLVMNEDAVNPASSLRGFRIPNANAASRYSVRRSDQRITDAPTV